MPELAVMAALLPTVREVVGDSTLVLTVPSGMLITTSEALRGWGAGWPRIDMICCKEPVGSWDELSGRMATTVPG